LRSAGHDVVLAAPAGYRGLAEPALVPFVPLDLDMAAVGHAVEGKHGLRHMLAFTKAMGRRAMIFGLIAAANRDPAQVKEPRRST